MATGSLLSTISAYLNLCYYDFLGIRWLRQQTSGSMSMTISRARLRWLRPPCGKSGVIEIQSFMVFPCLIPGAPESVTACFLSARLIRSSWRALAMGWMTSRGPPLGWFRNPLCGSFTSHCSVSTLAVIPRLDVGVVKAKFYRFHHVLQEKKG